MLDWKRYIDEGRVKRSQISLDVRNQKISHDDLLELIADPQISQAFFGSELRGKKPESEWDKNYLNLISYASVGEVFNAEYLLYLENVANKVNAARKRKRALLGAAVIIAIIIITVIAILVASSTPSSRLQSARYEREDNLTLCERKDCRCQI